MRQVIAGLLREIEKWKYISKQRKERTCKLHVVHKQSVAVERGDKKEKGTHKKKKKNKKGKKKGRKNVISYCNWVIAI